MLYDSYLSFASKPPHPTCKGKSFQYQAINKAFALTGRLADSHYTQGAALG